LTILAINKYEEAVIVCSNKNGLLPCTLGFLHLASMEFLNNASAKQDSSNVPAEKKTATFVLAFSYLV
jgi:hypothetical protein